MRIRISESADLNLNLRGPNRVIRASRRGRQGGSNRVRDQISLGEPSPLNISPRPPSSSLSCKRQKPISSWKPHTGVRKRKATDLSHDPIPCDEVYSPENRPISDPFVTRPTNDSLPISLNPFGNT